MRDEAAVQGVALVRAGLDLLLSSELTRCASTELTALLAEVEVERRRFESFDQQLLTEIGVRGVAGEYARHSGIDLLVELLRVSPREAKARLRRARDMGPRRELCGARLEPILPLVAQAQREGVISGEHATVIVGCIDKIPLQLARAATAVTEAFLLDCALQLDPTQVARAGQQLLARLDQDGSEPRERENERRRSLSLHINPDGTGALTGRLSPAAAATWRPILDTLSAPQPADGEGTRDQRSAGQRCHDGFLEAGQRLLRSATLPDSGCPTAAAHPPRCWCASTPTCCGSGVAIPARPAHSCSAATRRFIGSPPGR